MGPATEKGQFGLDYGDEFFLFQARNPTVFTYGEIDCLQKTLL